MASTFVVGYDGSTASKEALSLAIDLAKDKPGAKIFITCGHDRRPGWLGYEPMWKAAMEMEKFWDDMEQKIQADLEEAAKTVRAAGVEAGTACSRGNPASVVLGVARETEADLIIVGSRGAGRSEESTVLGSTTQELLHMTHLPVLVVPSQE